jgi:hypothetical protein
MWNNHLRVGFGTKSSRLEKWLLIPNTSLIDIESSFDVIDGINNEVKFLPEFVVKHFFGGGELLKSYNP